MAARYLVCLVLFKYLLLCDSAPDQCLGMGKAMRKLKCGETVQKEEKIYQDTTKHFESKYKGKMVQEHYVDLPYPPFSFSDMAREMSYYAGNVRGHPLFQQYANSLDMLNHYLYKGNQSFTDNFRILIAGGGTGNSVSFMGEQLRNSNAEVIYLDFSPASMAIAEQRINIRNLGNVKFLLGNIESLSDLKLGKFDFVESTGVLHHLPDPNQGLQALADSLKEEGGGNLMLYARYGRTGIYQMQDLARLVNEDVYDRTAELENVFTMIRTMGTGVFNKQNVLRRLDHTIDESSIFYDRILNPQMQALGSKDEVDAEAYDRFCNKQDRAFSVQEMYEFVESAGLKFVSFNNPRSYSNYNIDGKKLDDEQKVDILKLMEREHQAVAELIDGSIIGHHFFISKQEHSIAKLQEELVPFIYGNPAGLQESLDKYFEADENSKFEVKCSYEKTQFYLKLPLTKSIHYYLKYLFNDNDYTFGDLTTLISEVHDIKEEVLKQDFKEFYTSATKRDIVLLKHKETGRKRVGQLGKGLGLFVCT